MFTNYGPYDVQQVELLRQYQQRQLAAIYTAPTFEGVSVRADSADRVQSSRPYFRMVLTTLHNVFASAVQPLRRQPGRI
jgi:hypothetical protein